MCTYFDLSPILAYCIISYFDFYNETFNWLVTFLLDEKNE